MATLNIFKKKNLIICPYCNENLVEPPKTKKKCPNCKNPVYFKVDPYTKKQYYLNEQEARKIEKLQDRYRIEERFYNRFKDFGLTEQYFKKRQIDYEKKAGRNYLVFAFLNSLFNELTLDYAKRKDYQSLKCMYHAMGYFLYEFNIDRGHNHNFFFYLYESQKMDLYYHKSIEKQTGFKEKVGIMTYGKGYACDKCYELEGKTFTIDETLEKMPIPVKDCGNGFCMCSYFSKID